MTGLLEDPRSTRDKSARAGGSTTLAEGHSIDSLTLEHRRPASLGHHALAALNRIASFDLIAIATIILVAGAFALTNVVGAPAYQDDEGTYTAQALAVQSGSLAPYTYWYDHPPFGWIQLALLAFIAQALHLGDGTDIGMMRYVVCLYFVANAVLIYGITRRMRVARVFALLSVAVFVFSPLSLGLGRQVFLDSIALTWLLIGFYLVMSPRVGLWSHAASGAAFAIAVLTKLTAAIMGPALLLALIDRQAWRGRAFSIVGFLTVGALFLLNFPLMALLRGELFAGPGHVSLQDGLLYQFATRGGSGHLWEEGSARQQLLGGWMFNDGFLVVVGSIAAVVCLSSRRTRWIFVAVLSFLFPIVLGSGYLPGMYIVGGIPFFCIAVGTAADLLRRGVTRVATSVTSGWRGSPLIGMGVALTVLLSQIPVALWVERDTELMTVDNNADWHKALDWMTANVPKDSVVLTPYSMWQDLDKAGWNDPWMMIALEKADLDSEEYTLNHPGGWKEIQWIVEGPTVASNLGNLGLGEATAAFEHSRIVQEYGPWRIRQVDPNGEVISPIG